jgi:hypothetical protein
VRGDEGRGWQLQSASLSMRAGGAARQWGGKGGRGGRCSAAAPAP